MRTAFPIPGTGCLSLNTPKETPIFHERILSCVCLEPQARPLHFSVRNRITFGAGFCVVQMSRDKL